MTRCDELLTSLRELEEGAAILDDELSFWKLEELEAIHEEEELLLDTVDELVELSLELRMMRCDELLTSLRESEDSGSSPE